MKTIHILFVSIFTALLFFTKSTSVKACSTLYFQDVSTGKIYVANNEDYWYDTRAYIQIMPTKNDELARLWYGWDNFAQGGVNEAGLFFDGAVTPKQPYPEGYGKPKGNLGDALLAHCKTVDEAIAYLENKKIALDNAHMMFGDSSGLAKVVEWIDGEKRVTSIENNYLIMTNFLLADTSQGNYPCYRYSAILNAVQKLDQKNLDLAKVGNAIAPAVQVPKESENGKTGGTLYSTFINISDMQFVLVPKLDNARLIKLDLKDQFAARKKKRIKLK